MYLYFWSYGNKTLTVDTIQKALTNNGLGALAPYVKGNSDKEALEKARRGYSTAKGTRDTFINTFSRRDLDKELDSSKKGTKVLPILKSTPHKKGDQILADTVQLGSIEHQRIKGQYGSPYYMCKCTTATLLHLIAKQQIEKCPSCGMMFPDFTMNVADKYLFELGYVDNERRSKFYKKYINDFLGGVSAAPERGGYPYMTVDSSKDKIALVRQFMHDVGDNLTVLRVINDSEAAKPVKMSLEAQMKSLKEDLEEIKKDPSARKRDNHLSRVSALKGKAEIFASILKGESDSFLEQAKEMEGVLRAIIVGEEE